MFEVGATEGTTEFVSAVDCAISAGELALKYRLRTAVHDCRVLLRFIWLRANFAVACGLGPSASRQEFGEDEVVEECGLCLQ